METAIGPIFQWISGPFRNIAIMYVAMFVVLGALEIGIAEVKAFMKRKETDNYAKMAEDHI